MIGVDAAEISYLREHISDLPNFRQAFERGALINLSSEAALIPGSVWPSFFTESPPGEHGFYLILAWDSAAMRLRRVTADWLPMEPFWRDLARQGFDVIAVDVPMIGTAPDGPGIEIAGWGTHDGLSSFSVRPHKLASEIRRRFGAHPIGLEIPVEKTPAERKRIMRKLIDGARLKAELTKWLINTQRWDFLLVVFSELHRGGHILWPLGDSIDSEWLLEVYRAMDRALGEILACLRLADTTVAIFALHGMGPNNSQEHFTQKIMARINSRFGAAEGSSTTSVPLRRFSPVSMLRERLPARLQTAIALAVPQRIRDLVVDRTYTAGYDWRRTPAIALRSDRYGYIRLNIRGREREGMLEPGSPVLVKYIKELCEGFVSFRTELGQPLVEKIHFAPEIAPGTRTHLLPDIIVTWKNAPLASRIDSPLFGEIIAQPDTGRTGHHRTQGFMIVLAPEGQQSLSDTCEMSIENVGSLIRSRLSTGPSTAA